MNRRRATACRAGFTLLEAVLVVALVGLLTTLIMPSLGRARERARDLQVQATIAQHARVFAAYQTDYRDYYPALVPPDATSSTYFVGSQGYTINGYFGQVVAWPFGLAEAYYEGRVLPSLFERPGQESLPLPAYRYSASFMADPAFWNYPGRVGPSQWRGQRGPSVRFPSSKVLLTDDRVMYPRRTDARGAVALVDASARFVRVEDLTTPFPPGEGEWPGSWSSGCPGIHTVDGVFGRDLK